MNKTMCKILAMLLAGVLLLGCTAAAETAEVTEDHAVTGQTYPYLFQWSDNSDLAESEMPLYFVDGGDIPYAALSEYMPVLSDVLAANGKSGIGYEVAAGENSGVREFTVTRPDNGSVMRVYPDMDVLMFDNFNTFKSAVGSKLLVSVKGLPEVMNYRPMDLAYLSGLSEEELQAMVDGGVFDREAPGAEENAGNSLFTLKKGYYLNRAGKYVTLNLADYRIDIVEKDGECYIPFQTLNDLFMNDEYIWFVFNGEKVIGAGYDCSLINEMYTGKTHDMSPEFAQFNYEELCLLLDCKYVLKPEHGIDSFYQFFANNQEILQYLSGTDAMRASYAIAMLCLYYFDDLHSSFTFPSYLFERNEERDKLVKRAFFGPSMNQAIFQDGLYTTTREAFYGDKVPGYEEVGDTAFITFDSFDVLRQDYYDPSIDFSDPKDTIDLIIYANRQIKREGSPVKNIVIDLSNNGGGDSDAAIFVISWFLGEAAIALRDTFTGAETNAVYLADVNLDGEFDEQDNVAYGYRLYCMTSPSSFSCGNLVPAACRACGYVTLIGQTSGGGSCVVLPCTTAAGTVFQISGPMQISIIRNGSFYNVDAGVEPDVRLVKPESFYDRPALVEYLNSLK